MIRADSARVPIQGLRELLALADRREPGCLAGAVRELSLDNELSVRAKNAPKNSLATRPELSPAELSATCRSSTEEPNSDAPC